MSATTERIGPLGLHVGQRARRTQTVTAREVELYAQITGDRNPLHFDADFAARTRFGRLVAQGGIASGMLNALVAMDMPGAGTVFLSQTLTYKAPTYLGDTLTAEVEVLSLKADKPVCQLRATIANQDGTLLLEARVLDLHDAAGLSEVRSALAQLLLLQDAPQDLAGRRLGNRVDELDFAQGSCSRRAARTPCEDRVGREAGSLRHDERLGTSPASGSGLPITAASATPGCSNSSASSSAGAMPKPLYLIISFLRSTMVR